MKKIILTFLILLFSLNSNVVLSADIDLYELSIKYPQCQNSTYRHECFDDYPYGKDVKNRDAGYFRDNLMWEGLSWQNDVLTFETYEGVDKSVINCHKGLDVWYHCPDGQKHKPLEDGYIDLNGIKQGTFIAHFASGSVFEGNFENNVKTGYGKFTWPDGEVYAGNYENGTQNGYGKFTWPDGEVYAGNYENGTQNGYGKMTWPDGEVYAGNYENGTQNGYGKYTWPDGNIYEGNWENDAKTGYGKMTWSNGDIYEGNWENGNQNGYGKMTWLNADVYEGNWENGNMSD